MVGTPRASERVGQLTRAEIANDDRVHVAYRHGGPHWVSSNAALPEKTELHGQEGLIGVSESTEHLFGYIDFTVSKHASSLPAPISGVNGGRRCLYET